jgi:hypothetical protein
MGDLKDFAVQRKFDFDQSLGSAPGIPEEKPVIVKLSPGDSTTVDSLMERYRNLKKLIGRNKDSPEFLLVNAVDSLEKFLDSVDGLSETARKAFAYQKGKVNNYLRAAKCWDDEKSFNIIVEEGMPERYSLLISAEERRMHRVQSDDHKPKKVPWKKEKDYNVVLTLENARTAAALDAINLGSFEILALDRPVRFPRAECELKIKISGFKCELPKPERL